MEALGLIQFQMLLKNIFPVDDIRSIFLIDIAEDNQGCFADSRIRNLSDLSKRVVVKCQFANDHKKNWEYLHSLYLRHTNNCRYLYKGLTHLAVLLAAETGWSFLKEKRVYVGTERKILRGIMLLEYDESKILQVVDYLVA